MRKELIYFSPSIHWISVVVVCWICLGASLAYAGGGNTQKLGKVGGRITDLQTGEPLKGVTVRASPSGRSTLTDDDGFYGLELVAGTYQLSVSYIGYEPFSKGEIQVEDDRSIELNIPLSVSPSQLDEVIVIGYGEVRKADLTGSVGQVNVEEMQKAPVATFDQALAGRVAGVQVGGNDGQPGTPNQIVIRGNNSLTQSNEPLYVIDGYPVESFEELPVSPSDIESLQVLKDASATSIYGSRGANGVVIITTKQGLKGKPVVTLNSQYGMQRVTKFMDMMSPYEFVKYQRELNPTITDNLYLQNSTLDEYRNVKGHDMQRALYQTAPFLNTDVGFRGGNNGTQYAVFANVLRSDGVIINSGFNRAQGKFRLSQQLNKYIKAYVTATYTNTKTGGALVSEETGGSASLSKIYSVLGYRPVAGARDSLNLLEELFDPAVLEFTSGDYRVNPIISSKNEINDRVLNAMVINGYIDFELSKSLLLKIRGGITDNSLNRVSFYNSLTQRGNPNYSTSRGTTGSIFEQKSVNWLNENTLTYNKKVGNHKLDVLAGITFQERKAFVSGYTAEYIEDESLGIDGIDMATSLIPRTYHKEWSLASFISRLNYGYKEKYLLTASFRSDGSSKFKNQNKWGYFPSAAFAWLAHRESFLKNVNQLSALKLRVSYGLTGNNRVDEYATYSGIYFPIEASYSFNNSTPMMGASLNPSAGTGDLKWENTSQFNAGADIGLFNNRVSFVLDYYIKRTNDLLLNATLPYAMGYLTAFQNIGSVQNRGLEFSIQTQNIKRNNFSWNSSFNISFNRNKVLKLQDGQSYRLSTVSLGGGFSNLAPYIAEVGKPMGMLYGAVFDGLYQNEDFNELPDGSYELKDDVPGNGLARNTIQPGDMKFIDQNGDGTINSDDYTVIGNGNPLHVGGLLNDLRFGNFDVSIFLQWSYGNDIVNANRLYFEQNVLNLYNLNLYSSVENRWSADNQNTTIPRANSKSPVIYHSNIIENGSYIRLKTVSLGYDFSSKGLISKLNLKALRAYCSMQNIFTLTKYSGSDPEVSVRNSALTPGFDWSAYPRARTITLGLNVSF